MAELKISVEGNRVTITVPEAKEKAGQAVRGLLSADGLLPEGYELIIA